MKEFLYRIRLEKRGERGQRKTGGRIVIGGQESGTISRFAGW